MIKTVLDKIKNRTSDGILKHSSIYFIFTVLVTLCNIFFRKYISSALSIESFGVYTSMLAFYAMIITPLGVIPMYMSKKMAFFNGQKEYNKAFSFHRKITYSYLGIICGYAALLLLLSPIIKQGYHLTTTLPILLVACLLILNNSASMYTASLQSFQQFGKLGVATLAGVLAKIIAAVTIVHVITSTGIPNNQTYLFLPNILDIFGSFTYNSAFLSVNIGVTISMLVAIIFFMRQKKQHFSQYQPIKISAKDFLQETFPILLLTVLFGVFKNIDEYFARHFLSPYENGLYGAAVSIGKSSIFFVSGIVFVIFPKLSSNINDTPSSKRIMLKALLLTAAGFSCGLLFILFFPKQIISLLTHGKYVQAQSFLKWFFIAYIPFSFIMIFVSFFIINKSYLYNIMLLIMTGLIILLFQLFHGSLQQILLVLGISGYITLLFSIIIWLYHTSTAHRKERK